LWELYYQGNEGEAAKAAQAVLTAARILDEKYRGLDELLNHELFLFHARMYVLNMHSEQFVNARGHLDSAMNCLKLYPQNLDKDLSEEEWLNLTKKEIFYIETELNNKWLDEKIEPVAGGDAAR
jgi:hypothetical protein